MTSYNFSRPANDWVGDTFEEDNDNMAALALQTSGGASDDDDDEEVAAVVKLIPDDDVVASDAPTATVTPSDDEDTGGVDERIELDRLAEELKAVELEGIGELLDEESM